MPFGGRDNEATAGADPMEVLALILDRFRLRACPSSRLVPAAIAGGDAGLVDITILLLPPSGFAGFLALTTHTHTFTTLGSHRLEGQMLVLSKGADLQKG